MHLSSWSLSEILKSVLRIKIKFTIDYTVYKVITNVVHKYKKMPPLTTWF